MKQISQINLDRDKGTTNKLLDMALKNPHILSTKERQVWGNDLVKMFSDDVFDPIFELDTLALMIAQAQYLKDCDLIFNQTMQAKKSGWDDCKKAYNLT